MKGMTYRNDKTGEATVEHTCDARAVFDKLAIIVVTYKRQQLLEELLASFAQLTVAPWRIVIVDNEHSDETQDMVDEFREKADGLWGTTDADRKGGTSRVVYAPQTDNLGGAGGFSVGVKVAYDLGAEWFWVMDDDVLVIPEGIERLAKWTDRYDVIQGSRLDFDGGAFFWQYQLILSLGIPNPIAKWDLGPEGYRAMNQLCFEGGMFSRRVVDKIGLPDARFFIYGDDACYGYVAPPPWSPTWCSSAPAPSLTGISPASASSTPRATPTVTTSCATEASSLAICRSTVTTTPCCSAWAMPRPSARNSFAWLRSISALRPAFRRCGAA